MLLCGIVISPKDNIFSFWSLFVTSQCRKSKNRNARFNRSVFYIHVNEVFFCTKSITFYNFIINFFCLSRTFFEIRKLILQFSTRWHCEQSHSVAHIQFTILRHNIYRNSKSHSEIKRVTRNFSGHTVDIIKNVIKYFIEVWIFGLNFWQNIQYSSKITSWYISRAWYYKIFH